jgi:hypothetical protein
MAMAGLQVGPVDLRDAFNLCAKACLEPLRERKDPVLVTLRGDNSAGGHESQAPSRGKRIGTRQDTFVR